jgi:Tfp pilus assembly protein PilF
MTLVQVLTDEISVHMACDFRLTDPVTGRTTYNAAHKLVTAETANGPVLIGVTGVAFLDGKPVGDWIAEATGGLGLRASMEDLFDALRRGEIALARLLGAQDRRLTFMIGTFVGSQAIVAMVSNFEKIVDGRIRRAAVPERAMTISSIKPKSAVFFATGDAGTIREAEREELTLSLRSSASDERIHNQLRQLNETVSARTNTVSPGCHTSSLHAAGSGSSRPFLTEEQQGDFIPPEFALMMKQFGIQLNRKIGPDGKPMPIRIVQSVSARTGASREYFREQLKLQPENAEVWNNYGSFLAGQRRYADAISAFEKAHELNPSYVVASANLAKQVWLHQGDLTRANQLYREAVAAAKPSVPSWILSDFAIFCDEAMSDSDQAATLHNQASQDQNYPLAAAHRALFLLKHKIDLAKAKELFAFALEKQPDNPQILRLAGQADFFYFQDPEAARQKLHKACSLDPNDAYLLRLTADVCLAAGDSSSAAYYYRKLFKRQEYDAEAHGNYGLALLMERKSEAALHHLSKAARAAPDNLVIRMNLAAALWSRRRRSEAVALMRSIMESSSPREIELEANALLYIAEPRSANKATSRMRQLINDGIQADGTTLRAMVLGRPYAERKTADQLADIIEGKTPIPANW